MYKGIANGQNTYLKNPKCYSENTKETSVLQVNQNLTNVGPK